MSNQKHRDYYVKIENYNIRYWMEGNGKETIILLHGLGSMLESWQENIETLSKKYKVYAIDFLGFGYSEKPNISYSIERLSLFLDRFLKKLSEEKVILFGNSMGGTVALEYAKRFPKKVTSIVLIANAGFGKNISMGLRLLTIPFIGELLNKPTKNSIKHMLNTIYFDKKFVNQEYIDFSYNIASQPGAQQSFLSLLRSMGNFLGTKKSLLNRSKRTITSLKNPILVIWGKNDNLLPVEHAYKIKQDFLHVQVEIFNKCGHLPHMEYPDKFHQTVINFLKKNHL